MKETGKKLLARYYVEVFTLQLQLYLYLYRYFGIRSAPILVMLKFCLNKGLFIWWDCDCDIFIACNGSHRIQFTWYDYDNDTKPHTAHYTQSCERPLSLKYYLVRKVVICIHFNFHWSSIAYDFAFIYLQINTDQKPANSSTLRVCLTRQPEVPATVPF